MQIEVPAKTFLIGEYAVTQGFDGLILTTRPCFKLTVTEGSPDVVGIHPDSPAGLWLQKHPITNKSLCFSDPYQGMGGLGASTAQFFSVYKAYHQLNKQDIIQEKMLSDYLNVAWNGEGLPPSGYDLIAQSRHGIVHHNQKQKYTEVHTWPFEELSFFLLRTGKKLATHTHLRQKFVNLDLKSLAKIASYAVEAIGNNHPGHFLESINTYHASLLSQNLVASHSIAMINELKQHPNCLASKGCGAMGADILLAIVDKNRESSFVDTITTKSWEIVATSSALQQ